MIANDIELMAPAGSFESLTAALNAGADSVYFGVSQLNMRAKSSINFEINDLPAITEQCHKHNAKAYVTMNTLLYDHDLKMARSILEASANAGADAAIVADTAAVQIAKEAGIPIHLSTQLSISNTESIRFWAGFTDTIVLARELDLNMIRRITDTIREENITGPAGEPVRIEIFAHGALCIAVSGRCGMSLFTDNASANRGACRQNCRQSYVVTDKETGAQLEIDNEFIMSPNDICTLPFLDEVLNAGVRVLKIEGRGRSPDYTDMVIRTYREAISSIQDGSYNEDKIESWMKGLSKVYNRGFSDGYYLGRKQGWSKTNGSLATREKVYAGQVKKYFALPSVAEVHLQAASVQKGDEFLITGHTTGVIRGQIEELRNEAEQVIEQSTKREVVTFTVSEKVRPNDRVYILKKREAETKEPVSNR